MIIVQLTSAIMQSTLHLLRNHSNMLLICQMHIFCFLIRHFIHSHNFCSMLTFLLERASWSEIMMILYSTAVIFILYIRIRIHPFTGLLFLVAQLQHSIPSHKHLTILILVCTAFHHHHYFGQFCEEKEQMQFSSKLMGCSMCVNFMDIPILNLTKF